MFMCCCDTLSYPSGPGKLSSGSLDLCLFKVCACFWLRTEDGVSKTLLNRKY